MNHKQAICRRIDQHRDVLIDVSTRIRQRARRRDERGEVMVEVLETETLQRRVMRRLEDVGYPEPRDIDAD